MAIISHSEWLPITIYQATSTLESQEDPPFSSRSIGSRCSCGQISQSRHHLSITDTEQRVPLQLFYDSGTDKASSDIGLHQFEQISSNSTFQDGRDSSSAGDNRTRRLHVQTRPEGCIRSRTHPQRLTTLFGAGKPRYCIQLLIACFRIELGSTSLYEINAICSRAPSSKRDQAGLLFGRLLYPGKVQTKITGDSRLRDATSTRTWIPNQQGKECTYSKQGSGIFGLQDQLEKHDNFSSPSKGKQIASENQTGREESSPIMPMGGVVTWQDHCRDSSYLRSPSTHSPYPEGSSKEFANKSSSLGSQLHIDLQSKVGDPLVETQFTAEERLTYTPTSSIPLSTNDSCGCLRHRLGSPQPCTQQSRLLDRKRKTRIDQCQGTNSDLLCPTPPCKKFKGDRDQLTYRQHDRVEICDKVRRNSLCNLTGFGSQSPRSVQSSPTQGSVPSCRRNKEYRSRPAQPVGSTAVRIIHSKEIFQPSEEEMGQQVADRCVRSIPQLSTFSVLEPSTRPVCPADRCIPTKLDERRPVHVPTLAIDSTSVTKIATRQDPGSNADNPKVADTVLVSHAAKDETTQSTDNLENKSLESNRMALVNKKRKDEGMTDDLITHLNKANRHSTSRIYNSAWQKYADWCNEHHHEPEAYDTKQVLSFLHAFSHFSPSTLNGYRSSIASVLKVLYPESIPIAEDPDIIAFFRAKRQCTTNIPKLSDLETWDTAILTRYIEQQLSPSTNLSLYDLQQKLMLLLCLHTMWRPRSDIGRLQHRDTLLRYSPSDQSLAGAILHIRQPKEAQQKTIQLGLLADEKQVELCVVRCLETFLQNTSTFRENLAADHTLLLTNLNKPEELPPSSIQPKTAAAWVKTHMLKAGISREYTAHSIRAASSTKAVQRGVSISGVKQHANWSQESTTFERYYYKPVGQEHESTIIQNSIFSTAENRTTSESEAKATRIVLGTTYNTQVAEAKEEEVVQSRPWFKRWFS